MTICSLQELEKSSLRDLLRKKSPTFILGESNSCFFDVIERFEDCPEGLVDFNQSDWMNLCEPYNYQLLDRWETKRDDILEMFEEFKFAFGYSSTLEALEDSFWVYVFSSGSLVIPAIGEFTFLFVVIAGQFTKYLFR